MLKGEACQVVSHNIDIARSFYKILLYISPAGQFQPMGDVSVRLDQSRARVASQPQQTAPAAHRVHTAQLFTQSARPVLCQQK